MQRIALAVATILTALVLATPSHATLNACSAAKKKCVAKKAAALLKCHAKNEKPPGLTPALFATCLQKAKDKFDGGANPAKGCFAKLEAKFPGAGCLTTGDTAPLEAKVDAFVDDVVCELDPGSGTCPAPTPTAPNPTPTPTGCVPNGQSCATSSQCCSLSCMSGSCQVPTCTDGIKNGNETGIDCGGGTCPACPLGQGCLTITDCQVTTTCSGGMCVCAAGQSNCNGLLGDGCEVNTTSDNINCGVCGLACPGIQNCINSICQ